MSTYTSRITSVRYSLSGTKQAREDSWATIYEPDLLRGGQPLDNGPNDLRSGTTNPRLNCATCLGTKKTCLGHELNYDLKYPVINPFALAEISKWLKIVCLECGTLVVPRELLTPLAPKIRFARAVSISKLRGLPCPKCGHSHELIKRVKGEPLVFKAYGREDKVKTGEERTWYPHRIRDTFAQIPLETVEFLGKPMASPPSHFTLDSIKIIAVNARPDARRHIKKKKDDVTALTQLIITQSNKLGTDICSRVTETNPEAVKTIYELNNNYYELLCAKKAPNSVESISSRIKGKKGQIRDGMLGKKVIRISRSTIRGDANLHTGQVVTPYFVVKTQQVEEIVQDYNRARLMTYIYNGRANHPGCSAIRKASGRLIDIDQFNIEDLENGDAVMRDLMDGDPVNFNRQPSLTYRNICTHRAVVVTNPDMCSIHMDVTACKYYNADFDGDQMNQIHHTSIETRNETASNSTVSDFLISYTTSAPTTGQVDDGIIGLAELTRHGVKFDAYHFALIFQQIPIVPDIFSKKEFTGYDVITELLKDIPIDFSRDPMSYDKTIAHIVPYDKMDIRVEIENGVYKSGVLDKKSIGPGAVGGLYHIVALEHGNDAALDLIYNMKQAAIAHTKMHGLTTGFMDLLMPKAARMEVARISADMLNRANMITERLINGQIIAPIGKTVSQFYEELMINELKVTDDFRDTVLSAIDIVNNGIYKLTNTGSKGSFGNILHMVSQLGQKLINGERIHENFGIHRSLVYWPRFCTDPRARGFIRSSFMDGMKIDEFISAAQDARFSLISKALSTSITGDQCRKSVKNLESIITNNLRQSIKGTSIIQMLYGGDGFDPRKLEKVQFETVNISDAKLAEIYDYNTGAATKSDSSDVPDVTKHTDDKVRAAAADAFEKIIADRRRYRDIFLRLENNTRANLFTAERFLPVNLASIIRKYKKIPRVKRTSEQLIAAIKRVAEFCDDLPYAYTNETQAAIKARIPDVLRSACWLIVMQVRAHLRPAVLAEMPDELLETILVTVHTRIRLALIAPGTAIGIIAAMSFSEPLTQYMLDAHTRAASGGTENTGMHRVKEILGARDTTKMIAPSMLLRVHQSIEKDEARVKDIAASIETVTLSQLISPPISILYDKYGSMRYPPFAHEKVLFDEFARMNPLLPPPSDLLLWNVRIELSRAMLVLKNISVEVIVEKLRANNPDLYVIYSPENSRVIVLRIYIRASRFGKIVGENDIRALVADLLKQHLRGIRGIDSAMVEPLMRNRIQPDGSIARVVDAFAIVTSGTNLADMLRFKMPGGAPGIDNRSISTNSIQETCRVYGVAAARNKIMQEMSLIISNMNPRHYEIYANEMTVTGRVTSIEETGLRAREVGNNLLRMSFSSPVRVLESAACTAAEDVVTGISARLLVGNVPEIGTIYNKFRVNTEFVRANMVAPDSYFENL